ncbi:inhibitor of carbonic anhydrase-like [Orycteropus afer afer]|uniref:Inhibitor of carbonic anhydrase-like n=1 Tax=Orycteropus afer afer TaxID=1230840 RepID=A0A8B6ZJ42_ORYAF|nr:inhibitor of carbonic anhydrase-like [Orycteropus afer afer]
MLTPPTQAEVQPPSPYCRGKGAAVSLRANGSQRCPPASLRALGAPGLTRGRCGGSGEGYQSLLTKTQKKADPPDSWLFFWDYNYTYGLCLAVPERTVRWCTVSDHEARKCSSFRNSMMTVSPFDGPFVTCVKRTSYFECIEAITTNQADAVTLDAGWVYEAGLPPRNLKPVVAEFYRSKNNLKTHYYAVAVARKGSGFQLNQLQGKKACHTGLNSAAGWNVPINLLLYDLPKPHVPVESGKLAGAVSKFFSGSCVPCADPKMFPNLCQLCAGTRTAKCACNSQEPYFGYSGAFKCLMDGVGDVCFVRHISLLENLDKFQKDLFELLCPDNTRKPVDAYKECYLAWVPSHAVVARSADGKEDLIWELLSKAQEYFGKDKSAEFQLFDSPYGKDLLFTDAAHGFLKIPPKMDSWLYLGSEQITAIKNLRTGTYDTKQVQWCAVGNHEKAKCDNWSAVSGGILKCTVEETTEDCIAAIVKGTADAMSLDGGFIYTAGKCGLVPVLVENYMSRADNKDLASKCVNTPVQGYYTVAVVKKSDADLTWSSLRGKRSCHPAVGTSAGWNIPMNLIYNQTRSCKFDEFFSQSCAPGSHLNSSLCALCSSSLSSSVHTCVPNSHEKYYGFTGAFRCLVEKGDVAFVKHSTVLQNTDGKNTAPWAKDLKQEDFELLCLDGTRKPVTEAQSCHLAIVPSHAVVSSKEKAEFVRRVLLNQQELFGRSGFEYAMFQLFTSSGKDLLFSDDTQCLANLQSKTTYEKYLGPNYLMAFDNLRQCSTSELLEACIFHGN